MDQNKQIARQWLESAVLLEIKRNQGSTKNNCEEQITNLLIVDESLQIT